jgi:hypothetical protein
VAAAGDGQTYFPCPCRVGTALRRFLDVNAAPKKHFLVALAEHTAEPAPRARLLHLAARENQDAFHAHVLAGRRTHLDILEEFSSAQPPLGAVLQLLPRLHPRYYSISSSSRVAPGSVHVTAVVVRDELPGGREFRGVCTNYLARQPPGATLSGLLRRTAFKLPPDSKTPCIFIGAGTGRARPAGPPLGASRSNAVRLLSEVPVLCRTGTAAWDVHRAAVAKAGWGGAWAQHADFRVPEQETRLHLPGGRTKSLQPLPPNALLPVETVDHLRVLQTTDLASAAIRRRSRAGQQTGRLGRCTSRSAAMTRASRAKCTCSTRSTKMGHASSRSSTRVVAFLSAVRRLWRAKCRRR